MTNSIWLRLFFLFVVFQALLVASALVQPSLIALVLPWEASPLNARFTAALYAMGAISALLCMIAGRYVEVRISLIEIGLVTGGLLLITIPHFGEFTPANFPYRWTIFYTIDPLVTGLILWLLRGRDAKPAGRNPFAVLFMTYAVVLGVAGLILLVLPIVAGNMWPWALPPILGQVYSVFFLTFAVGGLLSAGEPRWAGVRVYVQANLGMFLIIIIVSLLHFSRFKPGLPTWTWFTLFLVGVIAFVIAWLRRPDLAAAQEALS